MAWPIVEAAIRGAVCGRARCADVRLLMTGGEPLLEFGRSCGGSSSTCVPRSRAAAARLHDCLTNGTRLGEEQIAFLARHRVTGADQHRRRRRRPSGSAGAWTIPALDALVSHLREHHRAWFQRSVRAAMTLVPQTIPFLADSVDHLIRRGFTTDRDLGRRQGDVPGWDEGLIPFSTISSPAVSLIARALPAHGRGAALELPPALVGRAVAVDRVGAASRAGTWPPWTSTGRSTAARSLVDPALDDGY